MVEVFAGLQVHGYGAILADPPWLFKLRSEKGGKKSPQAHYSCMVLDEVQALPVSSLAAPNCVLVMWATAPMLPQAIDTMRAWGFRYVSSGAWAKQSSTGEKWAFGPGYWHRSAAEFWLVGTIGNPPIRDRAIRNLMVAPVREHSRKPDFVYEMVTRMAEGPYCELFARQTYPGWDCWGNQTEMFSAAAE